MYLQRITSHMKQTVCFITADVAHHSLLFMNTVRSLTTRLEEQVHRCGGQNTRMMIILQCTQISSVAVLPVFPWLFFFFTFFGGNTTSLPSTPLYRRTACDCCDVKVSDDFYGFTVTLGLGCSSVECENVHEIKLNDSQM